MSTFETGLTTISISTASFLPLISISAVNTTFVSLSTIANFPSAYGASAGIVHLIVAPYSSFVVGRTKLVPDA